MTKKNILIVSLGYPLYVGLVLFTDKICKFSWCDIGANALIDFLLIIFFPMLPVFIFSLITYKMRDEVFEAWRNFSYWWIPLSIFLILITPESNSVIMSWGKEIPAIGMSLLYMGISIGVILGKGFKLRRWSTAGVILFSIFLTLLGIYVYRISF